MKTKQSLRLIVMALMLVGTSTNILAQEYITEVMTIGAKQGKGADLRKEYSNKGWTILGNDLNRNAGGWDVYIIWKTSSKANPETGYITDICASNKKLDSFEFEGRTYYRAANNSGFNGDLNRDAGGADIFIYYTRDRGQLNSYGADKRVITMLSVTNKTEDDDSWTAAISWRNSKYSGIADMNKEAGGDYIYIQQHFTTQKLKWDKNPTFASNLTYNGTAQNLVAVNTWKDNYGMLKYRLDGGAWSSNVPQATNVGRYKVEAFLEGKTANNIVFANNSDVITETVTINPPVVKAGDLRGVFNQGDRKVHLTWDIPSIPGNYSDFKWVVYRDGTKIAELAQSVHAYSDNDFTNEANPVYEVYYVSNFWDVTTKRDDAKATVTVNTTRTVPVNNFLVEQLDDRIVFTWTSDAYPEGFGHKFRIYAGDDNVRLYTLTPADKQTAFQWEHRTTDQHNNPQSKVDPETGVPYTEQPLSACDPRPYRIEGVIDDVVLNTYDINPKAIGGATKFYSIDASKGVYEGSVKLSWHVDQRGNYNAKTYIVERRRAEQEGETWETLTRLSSNEDYLFYTDETALPGVYYDYRVTVQDKCDDGTILNNEASNIGFAKSTGTVTGRIAYGSTGTAVQGVDVVMNMTSSEGDQLEQFHSIYFSDLNGAVTWQYPSKDYANEKFADGDFSIQMWLFPESFSESTIADFKDGVGLGMTASGGLAFSDGTNTMVFDGITLQQNQYNHLVLTRSGQTLTCYVLTPDTNSSEYNVQKATLTMTGSTLTMADAKQFSLGRFKGLADEFRLWTKCLTEADIMENYDHLLVGDEKQLETYWTFDEGLRTQFFDYSRDGTNYRKHHGNMGSNAQASTLTPAALKLKAKTDIDGNYIIQGIPFTGDGTGYSIVPLFGVHEFNPGKALRFVGKNALVHTADFEDVSSFPMRGHVYYTGTNVPVEGVQILVDGQTQSIGGKIAMTDEDGRYEISVPIGRHFIEARLAEHIMVDGGRYPTQGTFYFDRSVQHDFADSTLVNFVGRVSGGLQNDTLGVGFGVSRNNIGVAVITMQLNNESFSFNCQDDHITTATTERIWQSDTTAINSETKTGIGYDEKYIKIETDPLTGEFSALLPPLKYRLRSIQMKSDKSDVEFTSLGEVDLTNIIAEPKDSLGVLNDNDEMEYQYYTYNTKMVKTYFAPPQVDLWQEEGDGAFGEQHFKKYLISMSDTLDIDNVWTRQTDGTIKYTYDFPIFARKKEYKFGLHGYEVYTNYDGDEAVSDTIAMNGQVLTIANEMSNEQEVVARVIDTNATDLKPGDIYMLKTDQLRLDERGYNEVTFTTGAPNITAPYTRQFSLTYERNKRTYVGPEVNGVVLGELTNGNNFITEGPDHVDMVLRDPPGAKSKTTWKTGTSNTTLSYKTDGAYLDETGGVDMVWGVDVTTAVGVGVALVSTKNARRNDVLSEKGSFSWLWKDDESFVYTTADNISTSTGSKYVGSRGDVFIGKSHNFIIGSCRKLGFHREPTGIVLGLKDAVSINDSIRTNFMYTALEIEETMIPKIIDTRNSLLEYSDSLAAVNYNNTSENDVYLTWLQPSDERYGEDNTYVWKRGTKGGWQDMVMHYNESVKTWKQRLAENEQDKIEAINGTNYFKENRSFDGGTGYTYSERRDSTWTSTYAENYKSGLSNDFKTFCYVNDGWTFGLNAFLKVEAGYTGNRTDGDSEKRYIELDYDLNDGNPSTDFTVDIYRSPRGWGDIFVLRGGQSYNPYEGIEYARYYEPDEKHIISYGTEQMEQPSIGISTDGVIAAKSTTLTDIPAGSTGQFTLHLTNNSTTNQVMDFVYDLAVQEDSNQSGLGIFMDGLPANGRSVYVPSGETVKKIITVKQTDQSVLDYEGIRIRFRSQYQPIKIFDEVTLNAHFIPSSSPVDLVIAEPILNTENPSGELNIKLNNFDRQFRNLKNVGVQYRFSGNTQWVNLHTWVTNKADSIDSAYNLLPATGDLRLKVDMSSNLSYPEGTYEFRAFTTTPYGSDLVQVYSDVITVVKDTTRPRNLTTPSPTNGILRYGDDIVVEFNEDIVPGYVSDKNIIVTAKLNSQAIDHEVCKVIAPYAPEQKTINPVFLNGDFSFDFWAIWATPGSFLKLGQDWMSIGVDEEGHVYISVKDRKYVSKEVIPTMVWTYFSFSFNSSELTFSALAQYETTTAVLFSDEKMSSEVTNSINYTDDNYLYLGDVTGAIHDLCLYNISRNVYEAAATKNQTKDNYVYGLMNYWPMNEGHGRVAADTRHTHDFEVVDMWVLGADNHAVTFSDDLGMQANISEINTSPGDSYAIELWAQRSTYFDVEQTIFEFGSTPKNRVRLYYDNNFNVVLNYGEKQHIVATESVIPSPTNWNHFALNVVRGQAASFYCNGQRSAVITEVDVPPITGSVIKVGENMGFEGKIDELRIWHATLTEDRLLSNMYNCIDTAAVYSRGLVAYYPFEKDGIVDGVEEKVVTFENMAPGANGSDKMVNVDPENTRYDTNRGDFAPPLKAAPKESRIIAKPNASERKIVIRLEEGSGIKARDVEGTTLNITIDKIHDMHGNESYPIRWTTYVQLNTLKWMKDSVNIIKKYGDDYTFDVNIENRGGNQEYYSLYNMPQWLTLVDSERNDDIDPLKTKTLRFRVNPLAPIGNYDITIGLQGNNEILEPLRIVMKVRGEKPDWTVDPADYENSMSVVGQIYINGILMGNSESCLAAFMDGECRGVASPRQMRGAAYVPMSIYGTAMQQINGMPADLDKGRAITFRLWDATTGIAYPNVSITLPDGTVTDTLYFDPSKNYGSFDAPLIFTKTDLVEQHLALKKGWNWISLGVEPSKPKVSSVFKEVTSWEARLKDHDTGTSYCNGTIWTGNLKQVKANTMYKMLLERREQSKDLPPYIVIQGRQVKLAETPDSLKKGWNWLPFTPATTLYIEEALAGADPKIGDQVKSQTAFAYYGPYGWEGDLEALESGKGYLYMSTDPVTKTFVYPTVTQSSQGAKARKANSKKANRVSMFTPVSSNDYPDNMTMVLLLTNNGTPIADAELGVFVDGECRGAAVADTDGEQPLYYLLIAGEGSGQPMELRAAVDGSVITLTSDLMYSSDGNIGTPWEPYVIDISKAVGIGDVLNDESGKQSWYTLQGVRIGTNKPVSSGVYLQKGKKMVVK